MEFVAYMCYMEPVKSAQFKTDWNIDKVLRNCYSIFKKSLAKRSDYLEGNDLQESHEGKYTTYLFPLKHYGHRWLENRSAVKRLVDIQPYLKQYFEYLTENKKFPKKDDRFVFLKLIINLAILEFSLCDINDVEPLLKLETLLSSILK